MLAKDVAALVERRASSQGRRWEGRLTASGAESLVTGGVHRHRVSPQVPAFSEGRSGGQVLGEKRWSSVPSFIAQVGCRTRPVCRKKSTSCRDLAAGSGEPTL